MRHRWIGGVCLLATLLALAPLPAGADGPQCFEETPHCIQGVFLRYWQENGGLRQQGLPITAEYDHHLPSGQTVRVQYFERARFEWHPEFAGTENEVLLGLLGAEQLEGQQAGADAAQRFQRAEERVRQVEGRLSKLEETLHHPANGVLQHLNTVDQAVRDLQRVVNQLRTDLNRLTCIVNGIGQQVPPTC